jgi:hypothetical protein
MKKYIVIALLMFSAVSFGQSFDGVPISGNIDVAVSKFKAKGYKVSQNAESAVIMKGMVAGEEVQIFVLYTPKTKVVFKLTAYFDEKNTWYSLKSHYEKYVQIMTEKYGEPNSSYTSFSNPYYEGDGYEMSAVQLEKCNYAAYWMNKDNLTLGVEISKYKQVKLIYENDINVELYKKERGEQQKNIF